MIDISGLCFEYPGHRALDDVSLKVETGSVTALVGPNGAGKTTLMRCIAGLETPLEGTITVDGIDVAEHPREVHRNMGYLSDFFGLYQELSVSQCFEYAAASQGLGPAEIPAAIADTAARLGLADRLSQASGTLSRGLRQRVAIGQAIIHKPKLLLLDEPASGLDPEARASLAELFRYLQASGMTLLVSSHILAELDEYSTHMLSLRDGRVLENRALAHAKSSPTQRYLRIQLTVPDARVAEWLAARPQVRIRAQAATTVDLELSGDLSMQAVLLRQMVAEGFPICGFAEHKENLQQSYLQAAATKERAHG